MGSNPFGPDKESVGNEHGEHGEGEKELVEQAVGRLDDPAIASQQQKEGEDGNHLNQCSAKEGSAARVGALDIIGNPTFRACADVPTRSLLENVGLPDYALTFSPELLAAALPVEVLPDEFAL